MNVLLATKLETLYRPLNLDTVSVGSFKNLTKTLNEKI